MNKVKSAIITTLLIVAIAVLALFSTVSFPIVGNDAETLSSFISNIHLGSDLTGEAYSMLYPDGVISSADYENGVKINADDGKFKDNYSARGGVYVRKDKLENEEEFKASIIADAKVLNERFGRKGYSSYSVALEDGGFAIKVSVPTNYTFGEYINFVKYNEVPSSRSLINYTIQYFMLDGELSFRNSSTYEGSKSVLPSVNDKASDCFKDINLYSVAGNYFVRMIFTKEGLEKITSVVGADNKAYMFIGEHYLNDFDITVETLENVRNNTLSLAPSAGKSVAEDYATLFNTVINGKTLVNEYNGNPANSSNGIVSVTPALGSYAAIYLFVTLLAALAAVIIYSIIKYKKLGLVHTLMVLSYALSLICAVMLIEIQVTVAGAFTALLGLALLSFSNFRVFEAVRAESALGRTIQASVKSGYKKTLWTVLDLHIIMLVAALMFTLIGVGEVASCGLIFFISVIASYVLYWFTRFMWYVISSPVKDKFKFCGYKREAYDED